MTALVKIPTPLRRVTKGLDSVSLEGANLQELLSQLEKRFPGVRERIVDPSSGQLHRFVNIYVNGEDVRFLQGLQTSLKEGDEISIVPAVAGGC